MSGYFLNNAQKVRLHASLGAIEYIAIAVGDELDSEEFNPSDVLQTLAHIDGELAFIRQFIDHEFLTGDNSDKATGSVNE